MKRPIELGKIGAVEAVRGAAALYVFLGHALFIMVGKGHVAALPFRFVTEAVMAFFLVSGFAIGTSLLKNPNISWRTYLLRRFARIYPIFLLALVLAQLLTLKHGVDILGLFGNIFMLQDFSQAKPGVIVEQYRNSALWSLSYEWWFYIMFWPVWRCVRARWQLPLVSLCSSVAIIIYNAVPFGPILFVIFLPTWWVGVEIAKNRVGILSHSNIQVIGWVALPAGVLCAYAFFERHSGIAFGHHPFLEVRQMLACIAFLSLFFVIGGARFSRLGQIKILSEKVAPISYAIYALHFPIVVAVQAAGLDGWLGFFVAIIIVLVAASFAEGPFQRASNRLIIGRA